MKLKTLYWLSGLLFLNIAYGSTGDLIQSYRDAGAGPFSEADGKAAWIEKHQSPVGKKPRSCADCHGTDLSQPGRHIKTKKPIEPMALSVNPNRLSDTKQIEKWFRRNCRWTFGRECTHQEKGDFIRFITNQ
jgi:hypothetical protein